ncbi:MAG: aspartyl/asparaginyl beta-hydroxylase domain-containing protein [Steroidobacter sp.]
MSTVEELVRNAGQLANAGRWHEAERVWLEVRKLEPNNPRALFSLGVHAFQRGDLDGADELLRAARVVAPADPVILMTLVNLQRQRGDRDAEREAIDAVLTLDAYFLPGMLARASWLERFSTRASAASMYRNVLKVAPVENQWPAMLREQLLHAREVVAHYSSTLEAHLNARLTEARAALDPIAARRWEEATAIVAGRSKPFLSESNQLPIPRLPAIPFYEREQFPWLHLLESKTDEIRAELLAALQSQRDQFSPYIAYRPGDPVNQWRELNHSMKWSAFHLWRGGVPVEENLQRCPVTAQALASIPSADIVGLCPNAMFSALAPKAHIPPHHGETNARLVAHLPLIVPPGCWLRVGYEKREWNVGEVMVFDDTIEHEAFNGSDELRVVLIFDVWNPLLTLAEREMARAMTAAVREFN